MSQLPVLDKLTMTLLKLLKERIKINRCAITWAMIKKVSTKELLSIERINQLLLTDWTLTGGIRIKVPSSEEETCSIQIRSMMARN
jgi:hypothetical protein